jgi:Chromosome segregation ATPases
MRAQLQAERDGIETQVRALDQGGQHLNEEDQQINAQAAKLEERIRALAAEEANLQKRKKELQAEAQAIGERRTRTIAQRKRLAKERESYQAQLDQIDQRRASHDQQLAFDESQKEASFSQDSARAAAAAQAADAPNKSNNRSHPRLAVAVDVSMHTEHNFYTGLTENLSEGGVFIATYEVPALGTEIELTISLPNHPPIKTVGVVRWHREYNKFTSDVAPGIGVQFDTLAKPDHDAIIRFIREREPLLYETF